MHYAKQKRVEKRWNLAVNIRSPLIPHSQNNNSNNCNLLRCLLALITQCWGLKLSPYANLISSCLCLSHSGTNLMHQVTSISLQILSYVTCTFFDPRWNVIRLRDFAPDRTHSAAVSCSAHSDCHNEAADRIWCQFLRFYFFANRFKSTNDVFPSLGKWSVIQN